MGRLSYIGPLVGTGALVGGSVVLFDRIRGTYSYAFLLDNCVVPLMRQFLDAETAHDYAVAAAAWNISPKDVSPLNPLLDTKVWNISFDSPIGLAAGFDKNANAIDGLTDLGFGFVEIGSVTPLPQDGNPKPRMFRLKEDRAVINRYGFNSDGIGVVEKRLETYRNRHLHHSTDPFGTYYNYFLSFVGSKPSPKDTSSPPTTAAPDTPRRPGILGVNVGKNKYSISPYEDYTDGIRRLGPYADYLVVNVSSPNTPGLRSLQRKDAIREVLVEARRARDKILLGSGGLGEEKGGQRGEKDENTTTETNIAKTAATTTNGKNSPDRCRLRYIPLLVKIAPDLSDLELSDIVEVITQQEGGGENGGNGGNKDGILSKMLVDGVIISNTTIDRPITLKDKENAKEGGGLSGAPLREKSTEMVRKVYALTKGRLPIVGCGGVGTGEDAYEKILAGASLVQVYSMMVYEGPGCVKRIKEGLAHCLARDGYDNVQQAVGKGHTD